MTRRRLVAGGLALVAVGAAVAAAVAGVGRSPSAAATATTTDGAAATARVERRTLAQRAELDGTLGYADEQPLSVPGGGTVTWLPAAGSVVRAGQALVRRDDRPVIALSGSTPLYRRLEQGDDGRDVTVLERNLRALGYDPDHEMTVDDTYTWATAAAVRRWQEALGLDETGVVAPGDAVVLPGPRRVGALDARVGGPGGGRLYTTTATTREVAFTVAPEQRSLVAVGRSVDVELPDGSHVTGRIAEIARVVREEKDAQGGGETPVIDVLATFAKGTRLPALDQAPVTVRIVEEAERDALAVPVNALLALAGGGYAVEVERAGAHDLVPVQLGTFADGYVAITAQGLKAGDTVLVAQ